MKNHVIEPQALTKAKLMRKVLHEPENAIFSNDYEHFQNGPEFACKVVVLVYGKTFRQILKFLFFQFQLVWKTSMPMYGTAPAFRKGSIYTRFFKQTILDLTHAIQLNELDKSKFKIECINDTEDVAPISFRKIVLLYVILGSTILTSLLILLCEFMFHYNKGETLSI